MIALLQRVSEAEVHVNEKMVAETKKGILALVGVERSDSEKQADRLLQRVLAYRMSAEGRRLFEYLVQQARLEMDDIATGIFGADMKVSLVNDGPVTFWLQVSPVE